MEQAVFPEEEYRQAMKDQGKLPEEPIVVVEEAEGDSMNPLDAKISTAVTQAPSADVTVAAFQAEAESLLRYAEARVVQTKEDMNDANNDLSIIRRTRKRLEEKRKEYVQPLQEQEKQINATFRLVSDPLGQADKVTEDKILACRAEQERVRQEQERINALRMEAAQKEMKLTGELTEPVDLVEVAPEPAKHIYSGFGTTSIAGIWKWEVEDFALLSDEYKLPDATKIGKLVRAGMRSIPGVRIWMVENLRVSTRRE